MKGFCQILMFLIASSSVLPALAEVASAMLIGEWCLVHQSMNGHDFETRFPKAIRDNLRAKPQQSFHFLDSQTVQVTMAAEAGKKFTYKISGSKKNRIRIKRWQSFAVNSLTESEIIATVYGTVDHRFMRGRCE